MRRLLLLPISIALSLAGCVLENSCPSGEREICDDDGDCTCGEPCELGAGECSSDELCLEYHADPGYGACVDAAWADAHGHPSSACGDPCPDDHVCIRELAECVPYCTDDAECASGCCAGLSGSGLSACAPAAYCGGTDPGPGPGPSCTDLSGCLSVERFLDGASYCRNTGGGEVDVLPVLANGCSQTIRCRVCGRWGSSLSECTDWTFSAGDSLGGWATDFVWCDADGVNWACSAGDDDRSCLDGWP